MRSALPNQPAALLLVCAALLLPCAPRPARADGLGQMVRAVCLSAFENEMNQAGKTPPPGMATFACTCVEQHIRAGGGIEAARNTCRQATAQRFPI